MIVAAAEIEASLLARHGGGAKVCRHAGGYRLGTVARSARRSSGRSIACISSRLKKFPCRNASCSIASSGTSRAAGIEGGRNSTGYLVKPVRAASLAARFGAEDAFEHSSTEMAAEAAETISDSGTGFRAWSQRITTSMRSWRAPCLRKLGHRPTIASNGAAAFESWLAARSAGAP